MQIIEYNHSDDQNIWLVQIKNSDWNAGKYLFELLQSNTLKQLCGQSTKVLLLVEELALVSFCTLAEQDDVIDQALTPWVGFIYTYPKYRGKRFAEKLLQHAYFETKKAGKEHIYISTNEIGLYEKYGYSFLKMMKDRNGEETRVYVIDIV
jgi:GNAT superfamily N-acetyltransferase